MKTLIKLILLTNEDGMVWRNECYERGSTCIFSLETYEDVFRLDSEE
jgi:hypothetical protein